MRGLHAVRKASLHSVVSRTTPIAGSTLTSASQKLAELKEKLKKYEDKLAYKMKFYRGVIHESASSELKHAEVMVLRAMVDDLKREIAQIENQQ